MSPDPERAPEASLVLRKRFSTWVGLALVAPAVFGTMLGGQYFFGLAVRHEGLFALQGPAGILVMAGTAALWWTAIFVSVAWLGANTGVVTLDAEGVLLGQGRGVWQFAWADFREFRDGDRGFVRLVFKRWRLPIQGIALPTRDEATRVEVLARLDRAGIPRAS